MAMENKTRKINPQSFQLLEKWLKEGASSGRCPFYKKDIQYTRWHCRKTCSLLFKKTGEKIRVESNNNSNYNRAGYLEIPPAIKCPCQLYESAHVKEVAKLLLKAKGCFFPVLYHLRQLKRIEEEKEMNQNQKKEEKTYHDKFMDGASQTVIKKFKTFHDKVDEDIVSFMTDFIEKDNRTGHLEIREVHTIGVARMGNETESQLLVVFQYVP